MGPIRSTRAVTVVRREVTFKADLLFMHGKSDRTGAVASPSVYLDVDGRQVASKPSQQVKNDDGPQQLTEEFKYTFAAPGSHLVTVRIDQDELPGDNRRDFAVEVLAAMPVLIVDGDTRPNPKSHGSDFIHDALAPGRDKDPAFNIRTISINDFSGDSLNQSNTSDPTMVLRVVILHNIAELRPEQSKAVEMFLNSGKGVLMTLGLRVNGQLYNDDLYRDGHSWLPARLLEPIGDENDIEHAPRPIGSTLEHPALELFRREEPGGFSSAKFPRYWKLDTGSGEGSVIATLNNRAPCLSKRTSARGG